MPAKPPEPEKSLAQIVEELGSYPLDAFYFVQTGLAYTAQNIHGDKTDPNVRKHITGRQLSEGLRDLALQQWGLLAKTVLQRWNITCTEDFGRIVFALVDNGYMSKTDEDTIDDFKNIYDFRRAFEEGYRIECRT
jgi:uncharacterized repeat protein (TIGR04138 family)